MPDRVQIAATEGDKGPSRNIYDREITYHRKEEALYIGKGQNWPIKLCQASHAKAMEELSLLESLPSGATLEQVVAKVNEFLSALKGRSDE